MFNPGLIATHITKPRKATSQAKTCQRIQMEKENKKLGTIE